MNRKGPWEGYKLQAKRVSPVDSFPPSFARTFSSRERRLGTRQNVHSKSPMFNNFNNKRALKELSRVSAVKLSGLVGCNLQSKGYNK